jgi:hypothetical protein
VTLNEPAALASEAPMVTPPTTTAADAHAAVIRLVRLSLKFIWNIPFFDDRFSGDLPVRRWSRGRFAFRRAAVAPLVLKCIWQSG